MKHIVWNEQKNQILKAERGVCFEDVCAVIERKGWLDHYKHHNQQKYQNQCVFVVALYGYVYYVPYVETDSEIFLKTIIPSRNLVKKYLKGDEYEKR